MANKKLLSITSGVALFGAVLGGGIITASAQDSGSTQESTTDSSTREERQADYISKLAANLGIDTATLETALQDTALQIVDEQLAAGAITEERAAELRQAIQAGEFPIGPGFGGPRHHHGGGPGLHIGGADLAAFLGIDEATLRDALMSGSTLAEVAEANGASRDALKTFLTDEFSAALAERVAAGDLTQEEADEKLADFTETLDERIDGEFRGGPGPRGPRGGFGVPPTSDSSDDEDTALDAAA